MNVVTIERNADGVFSARTGTLELHSGKGSKAINRCHDIKEVLDSYDLARPIGVNTEVAQPSGVRKFFVQVSGVVLLYSSNAKRVYDFCDQLNRLMGLVPPPGPATTADDAGPFAGDSLPHEQPEDAQERAEDPFIDEPDLPKTAL